MTPKPDSLIPGPDTGRQEAKAAPVKVLWLQVGTELSGDPDPDGVVQAPRGRAVEAAGVLQLNFILMCVICHCMKKYLMLLLTACQLLGREMPH